MLPYGRKLLQLTRLIRFMVEGLEWDDRYRMVEDEFLSIAQRFTVHLHAAEYKRQVKLAKARNAEAISSISRPVTGKMPGETARKIEAIALAKEQRDALKSLAGKKSENGQDPDDSSDAEDLAYFGTTLHGLMDSPRRKTTSLAKAGSIGVATRAAAGFQRPATRSEPHQIQKHQSPTYKVTPRMGQSSKQRHESSTESSDLDDDLDVPIPAPKLSSLDKKTVSARDTLCDVPPRIKSSSSRTVEISGSVNVSKPASSNPKVHVDKESLGTSNTTTGAAHSRSRVGRRLDQARLQRAKQEKEAQDKKKLDLIPTFL
jgi:hypothetical protein